MACKVCEHPQREAVDTELAKGASLNSTAIKHGIVKGTLQRHKALGHIGRVMARPNEPRPFAVATDLAQLRANAEYLGQQAEQGGKIKEALLAIREQRACIDSFARILEQSTSSGQVALQHPLVRDLLVEIARILQGDDARALRLCQWLNDRLTRSPFAGPVPASPLYSPSVARETLNDSAFRDSLASDVSPEFADIIVQGHS